MSPQRKKNYTFGPQLTQTDNFGPKLTQTCNFGSQHRPNLVKINVDVSFAKGAKVRGSKSE